MTAWQVEPEDWKHHEEYDEYLLAVEEVLERTETEFGPWTLVEATDKYWTRIKIFTTLVSRMEEHLATHGFEVPEVGKTTMMTTRTKISSLGIDLE